MAGCDATALLDLREASVARISPRVVRMRAQRRAQLRSRGDDRLRDIRVPQCHADEPRGIALRPLSRC